jgi:CubicO group peptidase (beta-lactamase class C family)
VEQGLLPLVAVAGVADSAFALSERMERYRVPGVSLTVVDKGRIAWSAGYGVRESGRQGAVTDTTVFEAGSISKSVAAATALRLVEQGRLMLDADVNRTLRSWRVPSDSVTERRPVTLRALLSHSAGFNLPSFRGYQRGAALPTLTQILAGAAPANTPAARVEVTPGTEWRYSGAGTEVVRQLIEDATGRGYADVAMEEVLAPAGMCHSGFSQRPDTLGREVAAGHQAGTPISDGWLLHPELAAAGMWSTSADLARFGLALGASLHGRSGRLLREATMREAVRRQMDSWGLGFALGGGPGDSATFGHDGSTAGFTARLLMFADGRRGLAVMTNGESEALIDEIQRSVAAAYHWPARPRPVRTAVQLAPEQLTPLTGRYRIVVDDRMIDVGFNVAGDRLAFVGQSGRPAPLYAEAPNRFFSRESGTTFTFDTDGHSPARRVTIDQPGQRFVAERLR